MELFELLRQSEIDYIKDNWLPKKKQFLRFYTRRNANLGSNSNARSESTHIVICNRYVALAPPSRPPPHNTLICTVMRFRQFFAFNSLNRVH